MTRNSGLYGLFRFDGGPIDHGDAAALGLPVIGASGAALAEGIDHVAPGAVHRSDAGGRITLLVGELSDAPALAGRLGLIGETPPMELARAAFAKFGGDLPAAMLGEWTMLDWEPTGRLTLISSAACRDRLFFAIDGGRCAVAANLWTLADLPWVGDEIDAAGLLFAMGRGDLRRHAGDSTVLRGVRKLVPGGSAIITASGVRLQQALVLTAQPRWTGGFDDAIAESEALLGRIARERMARSAAPAILLSGGLDSSLLAWAFADQRLPGQPLHLITSVAPPGSGLTDEADVAAIVAAAIGGSIDPVAPPHDADTYRPPDHVIWGANGPLMSNRHALTEAFQLAAKALGATLLVNGTYGEMSLTGRAPVDPMLATLRAIARRMLRGPAPVPAEPQDAFHVRLSPHRRAHLPDAVLAGLNAPPDPPYVRRRDDPWGYLPGIERGLAQPNEFYPGALRMDFPYRDVRLLRLFASFPTGYFARNGLDRAPARRILAGRLPDSVRLRRSGKPASPDHMARLQRQATAARTRIAAFRRADVDDWLDLDWLDTALARVAAHGPATVVEANEVQLTALNAEMLTWWRTGR